MKDGDPFMLMGALCSAAANGSSATTQWWRWVLQWGKLSVRSILGVGKGLSSWGWSLSSPHLTSSPFSLDCQLAFCLPHQPGSDCTYQSRGCENCSALKLGSCQKHLWTCLWVSPLCFICQQGPSFCLLLMQLRMAWAACRLGWRSLWEGCECCFTWQQPWEKNGRDFWTHLVRCLGLWGKGVCTCGSAILGRECL